nr:MAG: ORF1 [Torque teno polar bear virus 47]
MAYINRRAWIRKRFGHFTGRPGTFRRRYYQRLWYRRRPRGSRRRRRVIPRRRQRVSTILLRQTNPAHRVKCTIRGWMTALWVTPEVPFFRPMKITDGRKIISGGWTLHELTLKNWYTDHKLLRNTWSKSNCGFDLARYHGCWIRLYPHWTVDYIVWWDVDYEDAGEFEKIMHRFHPALLLGRRNTTVVLSRTTLGRYRTKRVFLPRPSRFPSGWDTMGNWAVRKLGIIGISAIDLRFPFVKSGTTFTSHDHEGAVLGQWYADENITDWQDPAHHDNINIHVLVTKGNPVPIEDFWWNNKWTGDLSANAVEHYDDMNNLPITWALGWPRFNLNRNEDDYSYVQHNRGLNGYVAPMFGPFVQKNQRTDMQVVWTFKAIWTWGGDQIATDEPVCDPTTLEPQPPIPGHSQVRRRREVLDPEGFITIRDIGKDGYIKPKAFRRLIRATSPHTRFSHTPRENEEEESDSEISTEEEDPF